MLTCLRWFPAPPRRGLPTLLLISAAACASGDGETVTTPRPTPVAPTRVVLSPSTVTITGIGQTASVTASVATDAGPVVSPSVTWSSGAPAIATVTGSGMTAIVTGIAEGSATISATSGGGSGTVTVTVSVPVTTVTAVTIAPATLPLVVGGSNGTLTATVTTAAGTVTSPAVVWTSSNPTAVTVTGTGTTGTVIPVAVGSATITATSGGRSGTAVVTVTPPVLGATVAIDLRACPQTDGWMVVQTDSAAPWIRVTGVAGRFAVPTGGNRIGIAYASMASDRRIWTSVVYVPPAEVARVPASQLCEIGIDRDEPPADSVKRFLVNSVGVNTQDDLVWTVTGGVVSSGSFGLGGLGEIVTPRSGTHDMLAVAFDFFSSARAVFRRNINTDAQPAGSLLSPPLDFQQQLPATPLRVPNQPGSGSIQFKPFALVGSTCFYVPLAFSPTSIELSAFAVRFSLSEQISRPDRLFPMPLNSASGPFTFVAGEYFAGQAPAGYWLPAGTTRSGELQGALVSWSSAASIIVPGESRTVVQTGATVTGEFPLPSSLPAITPQVLPGERYRRLRVQYVLPTDLRDAAVAMYYGANGTILSLRVHGALLTGGAVDLTTPDFTNAPGWQDSFGPLGTVFFDVRGEGNTRTNACTAGRTLLSTRWGLT